MSVTNSNRRFFAAAGILLTVLMIFLLPAQKIAAALRVITQASRLSPVCRHLIQQ